MRYGAPYRFLSEEQRRVVCEAAHARDREIFMDCLAVLHELATSAGSGSGFTAFERWHVEALFSRVLEWNTPPLAELRRNIEINWKTADDLRTGRAEREVQEYADQFADDVLRQYQMLRRAEAAATATSSPFFS